VELYGPGEQEEVYSGLRTQDLQEAKDQLLVETSDMLHIPLFTAEALLRDNGQSIWPSVKVDEHRCVRLFIGSLRQPLAQGFKLEYARSDN